MTLRYNHTPGGGSLRLPLSANNSQSMSIPRRVENQFTKGIGLAEEVERRSMTKASNINAKKSTIVLRLALIDVRCR